MFLELTIVGAPYERGRQYGAAVPHLIDHSIASYARLFAYRRGLDWAASQEAAMAYLPVLREVAPDLLEEMRGIADGAGRQLGEILALNVRTELMAGVGGGVLHPGWPAARERNRAAGVHAHPDSGAAASTATPVDDGECTTAAAQPAATAAGGTVLAQTWDWSGDQRAACILLRVRAPGEPEILTMTEAGIVAKIGLNSAGVAVGLNLLRSAADGREVGMPVHVLLRKMLQARSFAEARAMADMAPAAGSSCITLASADGGLASLEITPAGVAEVPAEGGLLAHANHCLDAGAAAGECVIDPALTTTRERQGRSWDLLQAGRGRLEVADFQAILRDHDGDPRCICRHPDMRLSPVDRGESVCGIVIDLGAMVMHVAPDVPCAVPFTPVAL
ncbi:C45 family peptidase [Oscillochloris sp. ZM17-4]|uniref:C45 family autoproteolytic acyltransferase/hydolase n=1 Tax=Oscillochloris sp. ZM17-4 TaxID=2866714 RepID=UPI001C737C95|nr:C45 family peptidase [Oscillochloris sp. ZM17-4]MBX0327696.1 C45 family peptidase [Oscillochloris sp. ZM17-4]